MRINRIWFDRPGVHWGRAIVIAAVATVGVALWIGDERGLWDDAPTVANEVAALAAPASSAAPQRTSPAAAPSVVTQASTRAPSAALPAASEVRVCGLGSVPVGSDGPDMAASTHPLSPPEIVVHAMPGDERVWVPQAPSVWFRPLMLNTLAGQWCNLLRVRRAGQTTSVKIKVLERPTKETRPTPEQ